MRAIRLASVGLFVLAVMTATPVFAQQATIVGVVTDESKAVLPGVTVTVTDIAKGTQVVAVSDSVGEYRILQLTPGLYKLEASLQGFGRRATATAHTGHLLRRLHGPSLAFNRSGK